MQRDPAATGAHHWRALESLYRAAAINRLFPSMLVIEDAGVARIESVVEPAHFHAAGAVHGTAYFKLLDDAAFYAANSLVADRFLLTTAFNLFFTRPLMPGPVMAEGRWISGHSRVFVAEARLVDGGGQEVARGTGTFMKSRIALATLPGYAA